MREKGIVSSIEKGEVLVKIKRHAACLGCRVCSTLSGEDMMIKAVTPMDRIKAGDNVTLEIDSNLIVKAIVIIYLLPTIAFLTGILAGLRIAPLLGAYNYKEILSFLIGACLFCASLFLARVYEKRNRFSYQAKISGITKD